RRFQCEASSKSGSGKLSSSSRRRFPASDAVVWPPVSAFSADEASIFGFGCRAPATPLALIRQATIRIIWRIRFASHASRITPAERWSARVLRGQQRSKRDAQAREGENPSLARRASWVASQDRKPE